MATFRYLTFRSLSSTYWRTIYYRSDCMINNTIAKLHFGHRLENDLQSSLRIEAVKKALETEQMLHYSFSVVIRGFLSDDKTTTWKIFRDNLHLHQIEQYGSNSVNMIDWQGFKACCFQRTDCRQNLAFGYLWFFLKSPPKEGNFSACCTCSLINIFFSVVFNQ